MTFKPTGMGGYDNEQMERVRQSCLYLATRVGDLLDEIVVVGGLVPHLLVDQKNLPMELGPHSGTADLDLGFALAILEKERYRELSARLRNAGFSPDINRDGRPRLQSWTTDADQPVIVDFLIPASDSSDQAGTLRHIEADLAAIITPGLELAFEDRVLRPLYGRLPSGAMASRNVPVCGPGAFTVLKALAFGNRTENKDAYDLFYVWKGIGVDDVAERLAPLQPNKHVVDALEVIQRDFTEHSGPGPVGVANFLTDGRDDEHQADVVGLAQLLLRSLRRC